MIFVNSDPDPRIRYGFFGINAVVPIPVTLSIESSGGAVYSLPSGIACGDDCIGNYTVTDQITLFASADSGYRFVGWDGDCSGSERRTRITLNQESSSCRAVFIPYSSLPSDTVVAISAGDTGFHTCAVLANATIQCWGEGDTASDIPDTLAGTRLSPVPPSPRRPVSPSPQHCIVAFANTAQV